VLGFFWPNVRFALSVLADRGYFKEPEILKCFEAGITPWVPKTMASDNKAKGLFDKRDFIYIEANDEYRCPAGERLRRRHWGHREIRQGQACLGTAAGPGRVEVQAIDYPELSDPKGRKINYGRLE
jgi:hypothetical protein